ncbi:MAG TPA: glycosyltransferase family 2 protein [Polyangia bacterium]|nr:glycosyltransferase family 2 protein [Polyangia bacterium]
MTHPLVSVVIPTYNRGQMVLTAIGSALGQTYPSKEVVVVDDGSTDDTEAVVRQAYGDDARVRYVKKPNGGPASARNAGFAHTRGDYVALLDSDDTWHPWKLAAQIRCMERYPALGMTWTDMEMIDPAGQVADPAYLRTMYHAYTLFSTDQIFTESVALREVVPELAETVKDARLRMGEIYSQMIMGNLVHTSTVVLRRERLARVRGFDESLRRTGEDYDFHLRTCREGPVGLLDLASIRYQQGMPDRLTADHLRIHMVENLLRTVEGAIARDRAAIKLSDRTLRRRMAHIHASLAYERLQRGEAELARKHTFESLRRWPWQPELARSLPFVLLPGGTGVALRRRLRALKQLVRRSQAS